MAYTFQQAYESIENEPDRLARSFITSMMSDDAEEARPLFPPEGDLGQWKPFCDMLWIQYQSAGNKSSFFDYEEAQKQVTKQVELLRSTIEAFDALLSIGEQNDDAIDAFTNDHLLIPEPPEEARMDEEKGREVRKWIDAYIAWCKQWIPFAPELYTEACAIALLSIVAAGRVKVSGFGDDLPTSLYVMLFAESSTGKSASTGMAMKVLEKLGLYDQFVETSKLTPQLLLKRESGELPPKIDFDDMTENQEKAIRASVAWAGHRGYYYDEFGGFLHSILARQSNYNGLLNILLTAIDGRPTGIGSIMNGNNVIKDPHLTVLGNGTIADIQKIPSQSNPFGSGLFGRFIILTVPPQPYQRHRVRGRTTVPAEVLTPIHNFHARLGTPTVDIVRTETRRGSSVYEVRERITPVLYVTATPEAADAIERYHEFLERTSFERGEDAIPSEIEPNYRRLPGYSLRLAGLLAALENGGIIDLRVWAAAYGIMERWRHSLHEFIMQVKEGEESPEKELENRIFGYIKRQSKEGKWTTLRIISNRCHLSAPQTHKIIDGLMLAGQVVSIPGERGDTVKYAVAGTQTPQKKRGRPPINSKKK